MQKISILYGRSRKWLPACIFLTFFGLSFMLPIMLAPDRNQMPVARPIASQAYPKVDLVGMVAIWNGSIASIPEGWALCDGTEGTPNLTSRFVQSTEFLSIPGRTGGAVQHNHTYYELPRHTHSINDPGHTHSFTTKDFNSGPIADVTTPNYPEEYCYDFPNTDDTSKNNIILSIQANGSSGNLFTGSASNSPPFIRLPYIMKTSYTPSIPDGIILFWSGLLATIPTGWLACNGSHGTPNMNGLFVSGTDNESMVRTLGGASSHQHGYSSLPYHTHSYFDPGHSHEISVPEKALATPSNGTAHTYQFSSFLPITVTTGSVSGISIRSTGNANCVTDSADNLPPYMNLVPILKSTATDLLPGQVIFMWSKDLDQAPVKTAPCDGTNGRPDLYGKFIRSTSTNVEIWTIGGAASHKNTYSQFPMHAHAVTESNHAHTASIQPNTALHYTAGASAQHVSNYLMGSISTSSSVTGISVKESGDVYCATNMVDHLPPYFTLGFLWTQEPVQQNVEGNSEGCPDCPGATISMEAGLVMAGVLGVSIIISTRINRKKQIRKPVPMTDPVIPEEKGPDPSNL